ncbi:uncharacterized protein PRD47_009151 isoform 2-T2 [Ara ararauna]
MSPRRGTAARSRPSWEPGLFPTQLHDIEETARLRRKHIQTRARVYSNVSQSSPRRLTGARSPQALRAHGKAESHPVKGLCLVAAPARCLTLPGRRRRSPQSLRGEARPAPFSRRAQRLHPGPSASRAGRAPPRAPRSRSDATEGHPDKGGARNAGRRERGPSSAAPAARAPGCPPRARARPRPFPAPGDGAPAPPPPSPSFHSAGQPPGLARPPLTPSSLRSPEERFSPSAPPAPRRSASFPCPPPAAGGRRGPEVRGSAATAPPAARAPSRRPAPAARAAPPAPDTKRSRSDRQPGPPRPATAVTRRGRAAPAPCRRAPHHRGGPPGRKSTIYGIRSVCPANMQDWQNLLWHHIPEQALTLPFLPTALRKQ